MDEALREHERHCRERIAKVYERIGRLEVEVARLVARQTILIWLAGAVAAGVIGLLFEGRINAI